MKINLSAFIQPLVKLLMFIVGVATFHSSAMAVDTTWTGLSGSSTSWSDPNNWSGGLPTTSGTAYLPFASGTTVAFTTGTAYSVLFDVGAGNYTIGTLGTGTLALAGNSVIQMNASGTETFNTAIKLLGNSKFQSGYTGNDLMVFNGDITASGTQQLTLQSGADILTGTSFVFNGSLNDGTGRLSLFISRNYGGNYMDTVVLTGSNNFSGGIILAGYRAFLQVANGYSLGTVSASGTLIDLGSNQYGGGLKYTGTGDNLVGAVVTSSTMAGVVVMIDQSGPSGLLGLSGSFYATGSNVAKRLQLQGSTSGTGQYSGVISDGTTGATVSLTKAGSGTWILSGSNTYSGGTSGTGGVLNLQNSSALGTGTATVSSGAALQLQSGITVNNGLNLSGSGINNGGALQSISGSNTYSGAITLAGISRINSDAGTLYLTSVGLSMGSNTLILGGSGNMVVGSVLSGSGGLTKDGAGTVTLTNANSLTGLISLSAGTLSIGDGTGGNDGSIASSSSISVTNPLSSLVYNLSGTASRTYSNAIYGQGSLTMQGSGTLTLNGTNTFTGITRVTGGSLILGNTGALQASVLDSTSVAGSITLASGSTLSIGGISGNSGTTFSSLFSNNGYKNLTNLTFNTPAGVSNSTSAIITDGTAGSLSLTVSGSGTQILTGANTYTGATTVNAGGALQLGSSNTLSSSALALNNGSTLQLRAAGNTTFSSGTISLVTGTTTIDVANNGSGNNNTLTLSGSLFLAGNATSTINVTGSNGYSLALPTISASSTSGGPYVFTVNATTAAVSIGNFITGNYGSTLTFSGSNTATLTGFTLYSSGNNGIKINGGTVLLSQSNISTLRSNGTFGVTLTGGTMDVNNAGAFNNKGSSAGITLTLAGGTLDNTSAGAITMTATATQVWTGDFTFGGTQNLNLGIGLVSMSNSRIITTNGTATLTVGGGISGAGFSLTKAGPGTLALNGSSSYTGSTLVTAGSLVVGGSLNSTSDVSVSTGANLTVTGLVNAPIALSGGLQGNGSVAGAVSTVATASVSAGVTGSGTLTVSSLTLANSATIGLKLSSDGTGTAGTNWGKLAVTSTLDAISLTTPITLSLRTYNAVGGIGALASFNPNSNHTWANVITYGSLNGTLDASTYTFDTSGFASSINGSFSLVPHGNGFDLQYLAIPEPNSLIILACGAVMMLLFRRGRAGRVAQASRLLVVASPPQRTFFCGGRGL